jgi:hypothetical protein
MSLSLLQLCKYNAIHKTKIILVFNPFICYIRVNNLTVMSVSDCCMIHVILFFHLQI